jgi:hypothetical protein
MLNCNFPFYKAFEFKACAHSDIRVARVRHAMCRSIKKRIIDKSARLVKHWWCCNISFIGMCCAPATPTNVTAIGDCVNSVSSLGRQLDDLPYNNRYVRSNEYSPLLRKYRRTTAAPAKLPNFDKLILIL